MSDDRTRWVPCPLGLVGEPYESMWQEAQGQLREQGSWRVTDAPMLEALIELRRQATDARLAGFAEPTVIGSTGQVTANPLLAVADRAEALAARLATDLMLTARSRSAHDRDAGAGAENEPADEFAGLEGMEGMAPPSATSRKRKR